MISFRDRTFCNAKCSTECPIKLTETVLKEAKDWWGGNVMLL
jgi:hypothetical protein